MYNKGRISALIKHTYTHLNEVCSGFIVAENPMCVQHVASILQYAKNVMC